MKIIKSFKIGESIEFIAEGNESRFHGILTQGVFFNWIAFPEFNVSCELASLNDKYWNMRELSNIFENPQDVNVILEIIEWLENEFEEASYFDGKNFISTRDYVLWLESQCESLSNQMIELETIIGDDDLHSQLVKDRIHRYVFNATQYFGDIK